MRKPNGQPHPEHRPSLPGRGPILATKLYIPSPRPDAVVRPHLVETLHAGVDRPASIVLLAGPAGFGKTTLLSQFVAHLRRPVAWLSLDEDDNDPNRFWTNLVAACQSVLADAGESVLDVLSTPQPLPDETIPTLLINDLAMHDRDMVLVLDDYHELHNASVHAGVRFLLDHLPPNLHVVVSTRTDPPWPLVRYRARSRLVELRAQDLRFRDEEAAAFLHQTMGLALSAEEVAVLEARTEGWIAGLQLAALSMQGRHDISAFVHAFTGSHVYIAEYLLEEILQKQPQDVQRFLLQSAILERMSSALCEAVTECRGGQAMLRDLHRANVFIIPLDDEGHWFRYHHLFADLLRARLRQQFSADAIADLHRRAAGWYAQNGSVREAVHHALAAQDFENAAALVDQAGQTMIFGDHYSLRNWLAALPDESFRTHPRLEVYRVLLDLSLGTLDMYEQTLREKERLIRALPRSPENDRLRLEALVYLSVFLAHQNTSRAIQIAQEALAEIPEGDPKLRAYLFSALYRAYGMEGDVDQATHAYQECLRLAQVAGQIGIAANTTMVRAFDLCQYGRLDEAARYCRLILETGARSQQPVFFPAGPSCIGLAGIYLERHELERTDEYLTRGIEICRRGGLDGLYTGYLQKARLRQARDDLEGAWEELRLLEQSLQRRDFTLTARQVSLRLAMGDTAGAARLTAPLLKVLGESQYARHLPLIAQEAFKLCLTRIYLAQGELGQAVQLLDEIQATVEPGQRFGRLLEVHLLRARVEQERCAGNPSEAAIRSLVRALALAEPAGFVLLFLEEGPALLPLLDAVSGNRGAPARIRQYARKLQNAFAGMGQAAVPHPPAGDASGLVEPLTPREMEVLQVLATGNSNQAIAEKLVITERTVKKHVTNILGKLGAGNRTQAVARARELGLITSD